MDISCWLPSEPSDDNVQRLQCGVYIIVGYFSLSDEWRHNDEPSGLFGTSNFVENIEAGAEMRENAKRRVKKQ